MFALDRSTTPAMLLRLPPPMCGVDDHLRQVGEGVDAVRLVLEDVHPGARQVPGHDRLAQRALVDEAAAAAVHEIRAGRHRRQLGRTDQVVGLGRQRDVEGQDRRDAEELREVQPPRAEPLVHLGDRPPRVVDDARPERRHPLGDGPPDLPHPDDPHGRVGEVVDAERDHVRGREPSGPGRALAGGQPLHEGQHQHHRVLRGADPVDPRVVGDDHAGRGGRIEVDRVDPDADRLDEPDRPGRAQLRRADRPPGVHEHGRVRPEPRELCVVEARDRGDLDVRRQPLAEPFGETGQRRIGEQDLVHGQVSLAASGLAVGTASNVQETGR